MADPPPPRLFAFVIAASILVAGIGWFELHRDRDSDLEAVDGTDLPGEPGAAPTPTGGQGPAGLPEASPPPAHPDLVGRDGERVADPSLVPGKPGVGAPEGHGEADPDADDDWLNRNRNPSEYPPPPVVPPVVADRDPGQPPTPQGAGARAHELWSGEEDAVDEGVDPDAARADAQAAVDRHRAELARCFQAGQVPALAVTVAQIRQGDSLRGYVSTIVHADGSELGELVEECLMEVLEDLALSAPAGSSSAVVTVR